MLLGNANHWFWVRDNSSLWSCGEMMRLYLISYHWLDINTDIVFMSRSSTSHLCGTAAGTESQGQPGHQNMTLISLFPAKFSLEGERGAKSAFPLIIPALQGSRWDWELAPAWTEPACCSRKQKQSLGWLCRAISPGHAEFPEIPPRHAEFPEIPVQLEGVVSPSVVQGAIMFPSAFPHPSELPQQWHCLAVGQLSGRKIPVLFLVRGGNEWLSVHGTHECPAYYQCWYSSYAQHMDQGEGKYFLIAASAFLLAWCRDKGPALMDLRWEILRLIRSINEGIGQILAVQSSTLIALRLCFYVFSSPQKELLYLQRDVELLEKNQFAESRWGKWIRVDAFPTNLCGFWSDINLCLNVS